MWSVRAGWVACLMAVGGAMLTGCGEAGESPEAPQEASVLEVESAAEALSMVEDRLMSAEGRTVGFRVTSEGTFSASLEGELVLTSPTEVSMEASGTFGTDSVDLWVRGTMEGMSWGNADRSEEADLPPGLRESLVIGLVRMGVLHNLARLVSGAPPERTDGTVRSWVQADEAEWVSADPERGARGIAFGIWVYGERTADATVWLDADGRLVGRDQVVAFPGGAMRVEEWYELRE